MHHVTFANPLRDDKNLARPIKQDAETLELKRMTAHLRICLLIIAPMLLVGCQATMVPIHNLYNQPIPGNLDRQEIAEAITQGATSAGWTAEATIENSILAMYNIRAHTVVVNIGFSNTRYSILYKSSNHMKVRCGTRPDISKKPEVTVGGEVCTGDTVPTHIHENYKAWIEKLDKSISAALQSARFRKRTT